MELGTSCYLSKTQPCCERYDQREHYTYEKYVYQCVVASTFSLGPENRVVPHLVVWPGTDAMSIPYSARMAKWEYKFIHLYKAAPSASEAFAEFTAEVKQAGEDGWEAVGEIAVGQYGKYDPRSGGNINVALRALMLKRPLP